MFVLIGKIHQTLKTVFYAPNTLNTSMGFMFSTHISVIGYPDETLFLVFDISQEKVNLWIVEGRCQLTVKQAMSKSGQNANKEG